jgi:hypothetical protein
MRDRSLPQAPPVRYRMEAPSDRKDRPMRGSRTRALGVLLGSAVAWTGVPGWCPAEAQTLGERIGAALNRGAQATGRAAERAGAATGAAADRSLGWAQRKVRGENRGRERDTRRNRER